MKILNIIKSFLFILAIIFIFFNWKIAVSIFLGATIIHVIPFGPNLLLSVISGYLIIGGIFFLFIINWKIGTGLIASGFLIASFRIWGNRVNYDYYKKILTETRKKKNTSSNMAYLATPKF